MVVSSRFQEHFEVESLDNLTIYNTNFSGHSNHTLRQLCMDQQDYDYRRKSLTNTIDSFSSNNSTSEQCSLRRQSRVRTRRQREDSHGSSLFSSSVSNNSIVGWCLKQKSKISTKLRHL
jgi:hypothetical protein